MRGFNEKHMSALSWQIQHPEKMGHFHIFFLLVIFLNILEQKRNVVEIAIK